MEWVCKSCGAIFDEDEINVKTYTESRGEFWGASCSEEIVEYHCPECGSENIKENYEEDEEESE